MTAVESTGRVGQPAESMIAVWQRAAGYLSSSMRPRVITLKVQLMFPLVENAF